MRLSDKIKNISECLKSKSNSPQPMHKNSNSLILMKSFLNKADSKTPSTGSTPNANVRQVADSYAATKGIKLNHNIPVEPINTERATKIAHAYEAMPHTPNDPHVKKAYSALINETKDQFHHIMKNGLKISKMTPGMPNPYPTSKHMMDDIQNNNHLWYFPTEAGYGSGETKGHPLETQSVPDHEGKPMLANDMFRVVHDYFGHAKEGNGFGPKGEEAAWKHHSQMFSPDAQRALTSETRGQNSWVNFHPSVAEHNKTNPGQTKFAAQKAGLLPDWAMDQK